MIKKSIFACIALLTLLLSPLFAQHHPYYPYQPGQVVVLRQNPLVIKVYPPPTAYEPGKPWPEPTYYYRPGQDAKAILIQYWPPVK